MARKRDLNRRIREATQLAVRNTAVKIMNDLAEAGPEWSGRLKNAWVADAVGQKIGKSTGYPYSLRSVPALKTDIKSVEATPVKISVFNKTTYFAYAADLLPGKFWAKEDGPKGYARSGERNVGDNGVGFRGDLGGEGTNKSTASLDWYVNYLKGGGMKQATQNSIRISFRG